ncbi:MAG: 50S ribosomal protein L22 [Candidatus Hydrothermota bacterium]|uniref:Large ribosomal subunit protein uL22 n=1 Tax=candidate division WOR-3 bacterium TaxID=2052148 RepID=A0A7C1BFC9_UNCW3|nr:MAG: 50S ribosomal protein L22 [Candidatus Hydrothermae bacterium]RKZ00939.1 MAG: 50S ribosomal protein L22 [Candidatus Hydrothermae bacterium]HDM89708.1 50S ribosomal protein L22 [candidate division WOR-3 bacterium]
MTVGIARLRFQRISPKKMKPIADLVRGKSVVEARHILLLNSKKRGSRFLEKALKAALASYREKAGGEALPEEELVVRQAKVDKGPMLKRFRPAWRGRAVMIRRRLSHITVEVTERRI